MSIEKNDAFSQGLRIDRALTEAQIEAISNPTRYDFNEVASSLRNKLTKKAESGKE